MVAPVRARGSQAHPPAAKPADDTSLSEIYELVMRLALDGGLTPPQAADVCVVTMLRLLDRNGFADRLPPSAAEWLLQTAVEQCAVSRRLARWRRPHVVGVPTGRLGERS